MVSEDRRVSGTCVIGLQWGDEAKGKIVDLLTREHDIVVRYQGGANAGHTVVIGERSLQALADPQRHLDPRRAMRHRRRRGAQSRQGD